MPFVAYEPGPGAPPPPLIVVDLGFSTKKPTCGLRPPGDAPARNRSFGPMARGVRRFLLDHPSAVLVLEAPLSGCFETNGNPRRRGTWEDADEENGAKGWYHGAASTVALAAQRLLTLLAEDPDLRGRTIPLAEAFLTRAVPIDDHAEVAQSIYDHFPVVEPLWIDGGVVLHPAVPEPPGIWVFTAQNLGLAP